MNFVRYLLAVALALVAAAANSQGFTEAHPGCGARPWSATRSVAVFPNGDIAVTGCADKGRSDYNWLTVRYRGSDGAVLWSASYGGYGGGYDEGAAAIAIDGAGNVIATGYIANSYGTDIRTIKYDGATGAELWNIGFDDGTGNDTRAVAIALDAAGDVFLTGERGSGYGRDIFTLKYAGSTGELLWTARFEGPVGFDFGNAIVLDANGDAFVTGLSGEIDFGSNLRTIKYNGATGALVWTSHFGVSGNDEGIDAVVDPSGNLIVAGYTYESASGADYRVIKYANATGAILWTTTIAGVPIAGDTPTSVGVDGAGNVFVTGYADGGGYNMRTAKLDAATGGVLWNVSFNGPANADDYAWALAVDSNGDVMVTGTSHSCDTCPPEPRLRTIKYRGSDGAEVWNRTYANYSSGRAIAVDGDGDVIVAGDSRDDARSHMRLIKYASATGAQIWTATEPVVGAAGDFNADANPDILWSNTANGATYVWYMAGTALASDAFVATIDPSWKVQGIADFNGDGKLDLVWRNTANGNAYVWYMDGASFVSDAFLFSLPPQWVIQGVVDFNLDGGPDFLLRNTETGVAFVWFFSNATPVGDQYLFGIDPAWKVEQVGDVNGDGQPDLLFRNMASGLAFAWYTQYIGASLSLAGSSEAMFSIDPVWEVVQLTDWNADNNPDLLFRNRDTGLVFVWYMTGTTLGASQYVNQIDPVWEIVPRR